MLSQCMQCEASFLTFEKENIFWVGSKYVLKDEEESERLILGMSPLECFRSDIF